MVQNVFCPCSLRRFLWCSSQNLASDAIDEVVVTDTIPLSEEMKAIGKVRVLTLSSMLAKPFAALATKNLFLRCLTKLKFQ